jgi:class 3 adenylate cyclase/tetratricopeptide (TPR) repeat protein
MKCPACQHENRPVAKFCEECGTSLPRRCVACGAALSGSAKFCPECGQAASIGTASGAEKSLAPASTGERRQAAILFADISGYTAMCACMDPEQVQALLGQFFDAMDRTVLKYGGHVLDHAGDAITGVFGAPVAHGNDGERAVRAALEMHQAAGLLTDGADQPLRLHVGISSGEVVAAMLTGGAQARYAVTGDTVNLAARIDAMAGAGDTLISDSLYRSVSELVEADDLGELAFKGLAQPVRTWRVRALRSVVREAQQFVGRQTELGQLLRVVDSILESGRGATVCIRGDAGIGKSRLVEELTARAKGLGFACHTAQVLDFGVGTGQDAVPVILKQILKLAPQAEEADRRISLQRATSSRLISRDHEPFLRDLLDVKQEAEQRALFDAMDSGARDRRTGEAVAALILRAAAEQPRLVIVEDVHWAPATLLQQLALLTMSAPRGPVALVLTSRAEGDPLDKAWRASTHGGPLMTMDLAPLRPEEARALAAGLIETSERFALECIERAEGNPLFLNQLLRSASETTKTEVPATIQSLVLARMDRLDPLDKLALQAASVIGKRFSLDVLRAVTGDNELACDRLIVADLVRSDAGDYSFTHALIQEGVYSSLLRSRRRELHRRAADWYGEHERILRAEHLDRAEDGEAAESYLDAATEQAQRYRHDVVLRLITRGIELASGPVRCSLTLLHGELLREVGRSQESIDAFRAALDLADNESQRCNAWMGIAAGNRITGEFALAMQALAQAQPIAERLGLPAECSRIHHLRGNLFFAQGSNVECNDQHQIALEYAQRSADPTCEAQALSGLGDARYAQGRMLSALDYFRRCVELCERHDLVRVELSNRCMVAHCLHYANDLDGALSQLVTACEVAGRVGLVQAEILAQESMGFLHVARAEYDEAEVALQRSLSLARSAGARRYQSVDLYYLAHVRLVEKRVDAARAYLAEALDLAHQTGMGFLGPAIFGGMGLVAADRAERQRALHAGEEILRGNCVGHCYYWFYRDALDASIAGGDWEEAERYADALESYSRAEPIPWAQLMAARARALADVGRHGLDATRRTELERLRHRVQQASLSSALPAIHAALARAV